MPSGWLSGSQPGFFLYLCGIMKDDISIFSALTWLGRLAVADGVLTRRECVVISAFGDYYGLDVTDFIDWLAENHRDKVE